MPRVSAIVPTFNSAQFLGRSISSALAQSYTDYEVIVVDDGSTDETREVVAQFGDRVRCLYQPNRGPSAVRNLALSVANGELIAYLDADDVWYPHKLERQVKKHKEIVKEHKNNLSVQALSSQAEEEYNRSVGGQR